MAWHIVNNKNTLHVRKPVSVIQKDMRVTLQYEDQWRDHDARFYHAVGADPHEVFILGNCIITGRHVFEDDYGCQSVQFHENEDWQSVV